MTSRRKSLAIQPTRASTISQLPSPSTKSASSATAVAKRPQSLDIRRTQPRQPAEQTGAGNINVCVRIRPMVKSELETAEAIAWNWSNNTISYALNRRQSYTVGNEKTVNVPVDPYMAQSSYKFDYLFQPEHTNQMIFSTIVRKIVSNTMQGYHGSVFSYGQTSSGKTFTMNGGATQPGIIPQAIYYCFEAVNSFPDREFLIRVSYLEVYNEQIKDLLSTEPVQIKIQRDPKMGTVLTGVKEQVVLNPQQVIALIRAGEAHRHVGSTDMNEKSSRSHTLFKIIIESKERQEKIYNPDGAPISPAESLPSSGAARVSTLNLVDLAGSESAKMTNAKGERAAEAKFINQSLLTLSLIIQKLSEESKLSATASRKHRHLPYRDSKLTRLLETALDGNGFIAIICTISPASKCVDETSNTLKFATRAKMVKMNARVNEILDDKTLLRAYRQEIETLRAKLREFESKSAVTSPVAGAHHSAADGDAPISSEGKGPAASGVAGARSLGNGAAGRDSGDRDRDHEEPDPLQSSDDKLLMLQMIAEMERLILKADVSKSPSALSGAINGLLDADSSASATSTRRRSAGRSKQRQSLPISRSSVAGSAAPSTTLESIAEQQQQEWDSMLLQPENDGILSQDGMLSVGNGTNGINSAPSKRPSLLPTTRVMTSLPRSSSASGSGSASLDAAGANEGGIDLTSQSNTQRRGVSDVPRLAIPHNNNKNDNDDIDSDGEREGCGEDASPEEGQLVGRVFTASERARILKRIDSVRSSYDDSNSSKGAGGTGIDRDRRGVSRNARRNGVSTEPGGTRRRRRSHVGVATADSDSDADGDAVDDGRGSCIEEDEEEYDSEERYSDMYELSTGEEEEGEEEDYLSGSDGEEGEGGDARATRRRNARGRGRVGGPAAIEDDSVLFGVTKMLSMLKDFITKPPNERKVDGQTNQSSSSSSQEDGQQNAVEELLRQSSSADPFHLDAGASPVVARHSPSKRHSRPFPPLASPARTPPSPEMFTGGVFADGNKREDESDSVSGSVFSDKNPREEAPARGGGVAFVPASSPSLPGSTAPGRMESKESYAKAHGSRPPASSILIETSGVSGSATGGAISSQQQQLTENARAQYERLKLDLKLKSADNRFLQEELDKKDQMLSMLTEGLKEVEVNQGQLLKTNQDLAEEIDHALYENKLLHAEIRRLRGLLPPGVAAAPIRSSIAGLGLGSSSTGEGVHSHSLSHSHSHSYSKPPNSGRKHYSPPGSGRREEGGGNNGSSTARGGLGGSGKHGGDAAAAVGVADTLAPTRSTSIPTSPTDTIDSLPSSLAPSMSNSAASADGEAATGPLLVAGIGARRDYFIAVPPDSSDSAEASENDAPIKGAVDTTETNSTHDGISADDAQERASQPENVSPLSAGDMPPSPITAPIEALRAEGGGAGSSSVAAEDAERAVVVVEGSERNSIEDDVLQEVSSDDEKEVKESKNGKEEDSQKGKVHGSAGEETKVGGGRADGQPQPIGSHSPVRSEATQLTTTPESPMSELIKQSILAKLQLTPDRSTSDQQPAVHTAQHQQQQKQQRFLSSTPEKGSAGKGIGAMSINVAEEDTTCQSGDAMSDSNSTTSPFRGMRLDEPTGLGIGAGAGKGVDKELSLMGGEVESNRDNDASEGESTAGDFAPTLASDEGAAVGSCESDLIPAKKRKSMRHLFKKYTSGRLSFPDSSVGGGSEPFPSGEEGSPYADSTENNNSNSTGGSSKRFSFGGSMRPLSLRAGATGGGALEGDSSNSGISGSRGEKLSGDRDGGESLPPRPATVTGASSKSKRAFFGEESDAALAASAAAVSPLSSSEGSVSAKAKPKKGTAMMSPFSQLFKKKSSTKSDSNSGSGLMYGESGTVDL